MDTRGGYIAGSKAPFGNPAGLIARSLGREEGRVIYVALDDRLGLFVCFELLSVCLLGLIVWDSYMDQTA